MIAYLVLTIIFVLSIGLAIYLSIISKRAEKNEKEVIDNDIEKLADFELEKENYQYDILEEDSNEFKAKRIEEKDSIEEEII